MFITHLGSFMPEHAVSNDEIIGTDARWDSDKVIEKLGIESRFVADSIGLGHMLFGAAENLFASAETNLKSQIDGLIVCTQSPDQLIPTTACILQNRLGLPRRCAAFDVNLGCSGYIYCLAIAQGLISSGVCRRILILTGDRYTAHLSNDDVPNRLIFGDAGTASVVSRDSSGYGLRVLKPTLGTDGAGASHLESGLGGMYSSKKHLVMNGPEVFNFTVREVPQLVKSNLEENHIEFDQVSAFIFHQANKFMLDSLKTKLKISDKKWLTEFRLFGNTVSSTIPLVLERALRCNRFASGDIVHLVGFGVGFSWGAIPITV